MIKIEVIKVQNIQLKEVEISHQRIEKNPKIKGNLKKLAAVNFMTGLEFFAGIMMPFYTEWGQINYIQVMLLQSIFVGVHFLAEIPTGTLADKVGRKVTLALSLLTLPICFLLYSWKPDFRLFVTAECIAGFGFALRSGAQEAMLYDTLVELDREAESKKIIGRVGSTYLMGLMIALPIGGFIAGQWGLAETVRLTTIGPSIALIITLTLVEPLSERRKSIKESAYQLTKGALKQIKTNRSLRRIALTSLMISILAYVGVWSYQARLIELGMEIQYMGFVQMGMALVQVILLNKLGSLNKISKSNKRIIIGLISIMGVSYIIVGSLNDVIVICIVLMIGVGLSWGSTALISNYLNKHIASEDRATVVSTISMINIFT